MLCSQPGMVSLSYCGESGVAHPLPKPGNPVEGQRRYATDADTVSCRGFATNRRG